MKKPNQPPDALLVIRAREGDTSAFEALVRRYVPLAVAVARSRLKDTASAPDVAQEAFTAAFQRLRNLRTPERFAPWLRKIVVAECARLMRVRQSEARGTDQLATLTDGSDGPVEQPDPSDGSLARAAVQLLERLPPAQREAAALCLARGVSRTAAAAFLGVGENVLRKRLHDARRNLQAQVFRLARDTLGEEQMPRGFARRCVCRCERARRNER
jgi:RNA polymerase sigma-70 factor (ECF subfamily)